jgi:hypothetical protein
MALTCTMLRVRCRSADGWLVEVIALVSPRSGRPVEWLRVSRYGFYRAQVRTPGELVKLGIDLAELIETLAAPWRAAAVRCLAG